MFVTPLLNTTPFKVEAMVPIVAPVKTYETEGAPQLSIAVAFHEK